MSYDSLLAPLGNRVGYPDQVLPYGRALESVPTTRTQQPDPSPCLASPKPRHRFRAQLLRRLQLLQLIPHPLRIILTCRNCGNLPRLQIHIFHHSDPESILDAVNHNECIEEAASFL
jgi:hypothetical protein